MRLLYGEPYPDETDSQIGACNDFLRLGPNRSIKLLYHYYLDDTKIKQLPAIVLSMASLTALSKRFYWVDRAIEYDEMKESLKNLQMSQIYEDSIAETHIRVKKLIELEARLGEILDVFITPEEIKSFGVVGSSNLLREYRAILTDAGAEIREHKKTIVVEGSEDSPLQIRSPKNLSDLSNLSEAELDLLLSIQGKLEDEDEAEND